ncbi:1,4-alpha-glucan branching enzyme [Arboricoccus pini]|uniref:1,4-alpha-glucan branching enzyme GlgB n=1 Tax=Arboricoccus pini TaxID=1963835 RepID=A0A212R8K8_9PROT|nr:1,4-alpha-glucan branching protein GlgB [Arboricoccus pini]SNB68452.1 1,4-alpha-glucan branching enzyme [Arboricoccus pini]
MATIERKAPAYAAEPAAVAALVEGRHGDPFAILGMHGGNGQPLVVRTFQPGARAVRVLAGEALVAELTQTHAAGFFEGEIPLRQEPFAYRLRIAWAVGESEIEDPYRFGNILGEMDVYLLREGTHRKLYEKLGAHPSEMDGVAGTSFAVWAPSAQRVSVVGGFNYWDGRRHPMRNRIECGVWELFIPGVGEGELYKYEIIGADGTMLPQKSDPVALATERSPSTASIVKGLVDRPSRSNSWMVRREARQRRDQPISIYEVHAFSWRRVPEEDNRQLSWRELAEQLVPYVKDMGFTHIELLPISEFPFEGSWGYQPIGLFAPTSRGGDPRDFALFVDACHDADLGLILDWVPGHFPTDPHGLGHFDGTALYEHADPRQGFHQDWNTLIYNYGRREVSNFLLSNALFWLDRFAIDGLRVDAVASMLYLDYSRASDQWVPNKYGGNENLEAISFLKQMNELAYSEVDGAVTVAEESTSWPGVSRPVYLGGLGFGYKWNMGWMHDTLNYIQTDPLYRRFHQGELTFGLVYAFSENFVLPISHDEVVHGKGSLINKMPGDLWQKFANLRAYLAFMWTHPGKKLLFMGCEIAQWREWNHDSSLDWHLLADGPYHKGVQSLVRDLNHTYKKTPALHEFDCEAEGFEWIDYLDAEKSILAYLRKGTDSNRFVVVVCNFTPVVRHGYRLGVPHGGLYREVINTDAGDYGGSGVGNGGVVEGVEEGFHGRPASITLTLPPLSTLVLEPY